MKLPQLSLKGKNNEAFMRYFTARKLLLILFSDKKTNFD